MRVIPRQKVEISGNEIVSVLKWLFTAKRDDKKKAFETAFAEYIGVDHTVAVPSARTGFSIILDCLGLDEGDEIICSVFNYHVIPFIIKSKNLKPVLVDIDRRTHNVDSGLIEAKITPKTKAVIATHMFGAACAIDRISDICKKHGLILIEDAAHACGAKYKGQKLGSFGDIAFFSFGPGKSLTTLRGGMITSTREDLFTRISAVISERTYPPGMFAQLMFLLKPSLELIFTRRIFFILVVYPILIVLDTLGLDFIERMSGDRYTLKDAQFRDRLPQYTNLQAVIGLEQLKRIDALNQQRIRNANKLTELLEDIDELTLDPIPPEGEHIVLLFNIAGKNIEKLRKYLLYKGVDAKKTSMKDCAPMLGDEGGYPNARGIGDRVIELPCHPSLSNKDLYYQANAIRKFFNKEAVNP